MKFEEALVKLREGNRIKRKNWHGMGISKDDCADELIIKEILSEDWVVIEELGKTFDQVFEAFKNGKNLRRKTWPKEYIFSIRLNSANINKLDLLANDWEILE